jgi:hypothetical protein
MECGAIVLLYQPQFRVVGSSTFLPFGSPIPSVSVAVTGLSPNTAYDFNVVAQNSISSATSATVTASTTSATGGVAPGSVAGSQTTGTVDPVLTGPTAGTALRSGTLAIVGLTVSDAASGTPTTWNPNDKSTNYALSNQNLSALSGVADVTGSEGIRATSSRSAGKLYFEATISGTLTGTLSIGLATANWVRNVGTELGGDLDSFGWYPIASPTSPAQAAFINNQLLTSSTPNDVSGAIISFVFDLTNDLFWVTSPAMRAQGGVSTWNNNPQANPTLGTGGLSLATLNPGPYFIASCTTDSGAVVTLNTGNSAFGFTQPGGTTAWDGPSTLTVTTTTGTVTATASGATGLGTASMSYTNTFANIQAAMASLVFTAPAVVTTANVKVSVFDRVSATNSLTVPISVVAPVAPAPPTSLVLT